MEDLMLSHYEHSVLQRNKAKLESRLKVKLNMPEVQSCDDTDLIFANIVGQAQGISSVKRFLKRKVNQMRGKETIENETSVIILSSDNDSEADSVLSENVKNKRKRRKRKSSQKLPPVVNLDSTLDQEENESPKTENESPKTENESPKTENELNHDESVIVLETISNAQDFIPLFSQETSEIVKSNNDFDIIEISSDEDESNEKIIELPLVRKLRPVVIDGSNVACLHGKPTNTYSCKGIKISVDYFLQKGHPQVTAFVPLYRRHCRGGHFETTDQNLLEQLEKTQNVVFTPSRKVDGKTYSCYDDRFIVELAVKNGGVILSNDNFRDLLGFSPEYEKTIKERLLMFCFVGDILMLPEDPLGRNGPNLAEFLSCPVAENEKSD